MSAKKRVYELAKELGIDNKELIARLAGMGIVVKTHSSTLEDSEVERVKREFLASQPHELVEKRVKATVIRRRAVRVAEEQAAPAGAQTAPAEAAPAPPAEEEPPAEVKVPEPPVTPPPVKKAVPEAPPPVKGAAPTPRPAPRNPRRPCGRN